MHDIIAFDNFSAQLEPTFHVIWNVEDQIFAWHYPSKEMTKQSNYFISVTHLISIFAKKRRVVSHFSFFSPEKFSNFVA